MLAELHEQYGEAHWARALGTWQATTVFAATALRFTPAKTVALRLDANALKLLAQAHNFFVLW